MQQRPKTLYVLLVVGLALAAAPASGVSAIDDLQPPVVSAVAALPNPAALGNLVTITATVDDTLTGASNIQSAEFNVDGSAFAPMTASDGAFNSPTEAVTGSFSATELGVSEICVRGTDAAGWVSAEVCANLTTASQILFEGFFPPIKTEGKYVKAGRTIPIKWSLSGPDGSPISDPATFDGIFSYEVDCGTLMGEPATAVQEIGPGNATARPTAEGDWRALWQTPETYADSCRMMFVRFDDGSLSPEALFRFR